MVVYTAGCTATLPTSSAYVYLVEAYDATAGRRAAATSSEAQLAAAKLLLQGTFGPTRAEIHALAANLSAEASEHALAPFPSALPSDPLGIGRAHRHRTVSARTVLRPCLGLLRRV